MKVGVTLPQFRPSADGCLAAARAAESAGLDGVFVFDHLWAPGQPGRPALSPWPLLGALAAITDRVALGTLVARVGLLPTVLVVHNLDTLRRMIGPRLIAGLGTGDRLSRPENEAAGVPFAPADQRVQALVEACRRARDLGITTWVGGRSEPLRAAAAAHADALNLWGVEPHEVGQESARQRAVTWGGPVPAGVEEAAGLLRRLAAAGATWAVCGPAYGSAAEVAPAVGAVAEAAAAARERP